MITRTDARCEDCGKRCKLAYHKCFCGSYNIKAIRCCYCQHPIELGQDATWPRMGETYAAHQSCFTANHGDWSTYKAPKTEVTPAIPTTTIEVEPTSDTSDFVEPVVLVPQMCETIYDSVYILISARIPVYIYGPAGCGKSHMCEVAAQRLGMDFRSISLNVMTMPSALLGFIDANGVYRSTDFRKVWETGGVFLVDEMDNASGNLLTTLNSGLANGYIAFPDGLIRRHVDCEIVASGNTTGRGKTAQYISRQTLDAATLDRFVYLSHGYDADLELTLARCESPNGHCSGHVSYVECTDVAKRVAWTKLVQRVRQNAVTHGLQVVVSMRPIVVGCKLLHHYTASSLLEMLVLKGTDGDSKAKLLQGVGL